MSDIVSFSPVRAIDKNGQSVAGALARFFNSGSTTPTTVFADVAEGVPHPVPLVADSRGVFPPVYRSGVPLRVVVTDPDGVTLPGFPIDPAITVAALGSGAGEISFSPTGAIPETDVQAAIERVQANLVAPLLAGGIGVTGENTLLANFNATDTPSGFYRFSDTTTGDRPDGWAGSDTGVVSFLRENATSGLMSAIRRGSAGLWHRRLNAGTWAAWVRVIDSGQVQDQAAWNAGTSTTESAISPSKLDAKIPDKLNAGGAAPIYACRAWVNFNGTTTPPTIRASGNVSSVVRNGLGNYTVNFATPMQDANYSVVTSRQRSVQGNSTQDLAVADYTASSVRVIATWANFNTGGVEDTPIANVSIFR